MITFTPNTWSTARAQAFLSAGKSIHLLPGDYTVTGPLTFTESHTGMSGDNAEISYYGTTEVLVFSEGSSGVVRGIRINGRSTATSGVYYNNGDIALRDFEIRNCATGIYLYKAQIAEIGVGLLSACSSYGIDGDTAETLNHINLYKIKTRVCGVGMRMRKVKSLHVDYCDFESSQGYAVEMAASGGGAMQSINFTRCWFEANNTSYTAEDDRAEIRLVSSGGLIIHNPRFEHCYFALVNGQGGSENISTYHIEYGASDDEPEIVGGWGSPVLTRQLA